MNRITVHAPLKGQLDGITQLVELVDEAGKRLGHFVPAGMTARADSCPYTAEELEQMRRERGGRSLQEIWTSLGVR